MNELNHKQTSQRSHDCQGNAQTIPKQAVDIVDMANSVNILSNTYRKQLALDAMTSTSGNLTSTSAYLNIHMSGIYVWGKQDTGAELNAMPLNIYDELRQKCQLEIRPHGDINIIGYNKQLIECVGKVVVQCQYKGIAKSVSFYVTSVNDKKVILGLNFCKQFKLVSMHCGDDYDCKKVSLDVINNEFLQGLSVPDNISINAEQTKLPPVNISVMVREKY